MAIRTLLNNSSDNTELTNSLKNNDEFAFAHLIKFERPGLSTSNGIATNKAESYIYLTDASYNIDFDDGSTDNSLPPVSNGTQTYIANKVQKLGNISETVKAKASNTTLTLSGTGLGTIVTATFTFTSDSVTSSIDLHEAGFVEGDLILFEKTGGANNDVVVRIDGFSNGNKTVSTTNITGGLIFNGVMTEYNVSLVSEEIKGLFMDKSASDYGTYINRSVTIYRAHISPTTGEIIGAPWVLFNGIISSASVKDNVMGKSTVTWNLTSHWGDFLRVTGRLTQDNSHRALNSAGEPDIDALKNPYYAGDLGFIHAERGVSLLATYQASETRYKTKKRGGLAGVFGGVRMVEYQEQVEREVDLRFNLTAKYLPVIYGVQKTKGIPIFADANKNNPNEVYLAQAFCEGEIHGLYDFYIEDQPLVCINSVDSDSRSSGSGSVLCAGRADKGDVLSSSVDYLGSNTIDGALNQISWIEDNYGSESAEFVEDLLDASIAQNNNLANGRGLIHEYSYSVSTPIDIDMVVHTGKEFQNADSLLAGIAANNNFKLQNEIYSNSSLQYWGPSHRVLDTAYASMKFTIADGETTIPSIEAVVKGKLVDCHNYDSSYPGSGIHTNFLLGDDVTLHKTSDDSQIGASSVQIIDKWSYHDQAGNLTYRFRFSENPQASETAFYMKDSSNNKWYFETEEYKEEENGTAQALQSPAISAVTEVDQYNASLTLTTPNTEFETIAALANNRYLVTFSVGSQKKTYYGPSYNASANTLTLRTSLATDLIYRRGTGGNVDFANAIKLSASSSSTDDTYNNSNITISFFDSVTNARTDYRRKIVDYIGVYKVAILDIPLPEVPTSTTKYTIGGSLGLDTRVTTNPAMQLLDYLTSNRYGKGLDIDTEIDLDSFKQAAIDCDDRSNVTVQLVASAVTTTPAVGSVYHLRDSSSGTLFQGKVKSTETNTYSGTSYIQVEFEEVIGKLAYVWTDWRSFPKGSYFYYNGKVKEVTSTGTISTSVRDSATGTSITLDKKSGTGDSTIAVTTTDGTTSGYNNNPVVKKFTNESSGFTSPGYSLYDSDDCVYWVYLGWDEPEQRYVTRHQLNQTVDTSVPVFDNINSMLDQFNGVLSYSNGKYSLMVKQKAPSTFDDVEIISDDDIIGEVSVDDKGQKDTFNSLTSQIVDPQNKFGGRSITFTNSTYLKEDKGVTRQGNYSLPGITNYFNARMNIKQYLDDSRYGLKVSFRIGQQGYLLSPGQLIKLSYSRFGWSDKYFRIDSLSFNAGGVTSIVALEHNEDSFVIDNLKTAGSDAVSNGGDSSENPFQTNIAVSQLTATTDDLGGITVSWNHPTGYDSSIHTVEILRSDTNDRSSAVTIAELSEGTVFEDVVNSTSNVTRYYWARVYSVYSSNLRTRKIYGDYFPASTSAGVEGSARLGDSSLNVAIISNSEGFVFKNGTGTEKQLSVLVYDSATGANLTSTVTNYEWLKNGSAVYVDSNTRIVNSGDPGAVVANGNFPTIIVGHEDIADGSSDLIEVEVSI